MLAGKDKQIKKKKLVKFTLCYIMFIVTKNERKFQTLSFKPIICWYSQRAFN